MSAGFGPITTSVQFAGNRYRLDRNPANTTISTDPEQRVFMRVGRVVQGGLGTHWKAMSIAPGVVIGRSGSIGGSQYLKSDFWPLNTTLWVTDFKGNDPRFCHYLLSSLDLTTFNAGGAVPTLNRNHIAPVPVSIPEELETQRRIAGVLGALDDKIEQSKRIGQTLEAIARAIFRSWFIDFEPLLALRDGLSDDEVARRFALEHPIALRHFNAQLRSIEGQPVPEGWRLSSLGDEVRAHGGLLQTGPFGSQLHASDYVEVGVPVVMPQDLVSRRITTERIARVPEEVADSLRRHKLQVGDIVYSRRGDVERHARVTARETGWLCGTGCLLVRMGSAWPSHAYLSELLNDGLTREWIVRHAVGATMPNLNTSILSALPVLIPPLELLQEFERVTAPLMAQQEALSAEAESLTQLRDDLLPRLLSGELVAP